MFYILTSSGNTLEVDVRLQEVRKGDPAVTATLALALKPALSKEVFSEQQEYLITSSKAAYVALNNIDQRNRFKASVNIHSASLNEVNLIAGSSSACLGFTLALFNAFWTKQLCKGKGLTNAIFATGEVQSNGDIKAISYLQEKLQSTIAFAQEHQLSQFIICIPQSNAADIPDTLQKQIEQSGGQILSARRLPDLLGLLLGSEYDGEALGRWTPFKGLKSFEYEDSIRFFGRDREIERLYDDLEHNRGILIVSGPSGSGKSSLVKAGLIPKLASQKSNFKWTSITPTLLSQPLVTFLLSESLDIGEPGGGMDEKLNTNISSLISHPEASFNELVKEINKHDRLFLLHIDQFEDFFTQDVNHKNLEDLQLIHKLTKATDNVKVILSIRNEYLSILLESGFIASPVISNVSENLSVEAWRDIVIQQAAFSGVNYENTPENLAQRIINEAVKTSNALPMVEFVLEQLYEQAKQEDINANYLRNQDYDAFGGITGAIAQRAENAVKLSDADGKTIHHFFSVFVGVTSDGIPYAKQVVINEPVTNANTELTALIQALLDSNIVMKVGSSELIMMKLSHDSLFQHWERLKDWLIEKASFLDWKNTIELNYQRWLKNGLNKKHLINDNSLLDEGVAFFEEHTLVDSELSQYVNDSKGYKRKKIITNFGLFVVLPSLLILLFLWDKSITRSEYYAAVGYRWEVPFGVGELNAEQLKKKQFRYQLIYQGGWISKSLGYGDNLLELRHENSLGYLMRNKLFHDTTVARTEFIYKQSGKLDTAIDYDMSGTLIQKRTYEFFDNIVTVLYMDQENFAKNYQSGLLFNENPYHINNILNIKKILEPNGLVKSEEYFKDQLGNPTFSDEGAYGYSYTYNEVGLKETRIFYSGGTSLNLVNSTSKNNLTTKHSYNELGLIIRDELGYRKNKTTKNLSEDPMRIDYVYDDYGNYLDTTFYNTKNEMLKHVGASHKGKIERDSKGRALIYKPSSINPGNSKSSRIKILYNEQNFVYRIININGFDESFEIDGQAASEFHYNSKGQQYKEIYLDNTLEVANLEGKRHSGYEKKYNSKGLLIETVLLDKNLSPIQYESQVSKIVHDYNRLGLLRKVTSFDYQGELIRNSSSGCAIYEIKYNRNFQKHTESCFDSNFSLTPFQFNDFGQVSEVKYQIDRFNNLTKVTFYNKYNNLTLFPAADVAGAIFDYDQLSRKVLEVFLGPNGSPMLHSSCDYHCAGIKYSYYDNLNQFTVLYLGIDKKPTHMPEIGYAGTETHLDQYGNVLKEIFLGVDEKPALHSQFNIAGVENKMDSNGNQIEFFTLGLNRQPMIPNDAYYAGWSKKFDRHGNQLRFITLGPDRNPIADPENGIAGSKTRFDNKGNIVAEISLGVDELPFYDEISGGAGFSFEYDLKGNIKKQMNLGIDEKPMISPINGIAGLETFYDSDGNVINKIALDIEGNPIPTQ